MKGMFFDRRWLYLLACLLLGAVTDVTAADPTNAGMKVLQTSPSCVLSRLGRVSVTLGTKDANPRSGTPPSGVSYQKAFAKLMDAAEAKGADAVVLRGHEAAYVAKGTRRSRRPTYVSLQGAAIRLDASATPCDLDLIDPAEFERHASASERQEVVKDTGTAL